MKTPIYHLTLLILISIVIMSCSKSDINKNDDVQSIASIKEKVGQLGLDTTNILINNETIIAEGDIVLTISDLNKTSPRQASTINIANGVYPIDYSRHRNLKYFISSTVSSWESAIQSAFSEYHLLPNFNLRFTRTTNVSEADLIMESGSLAVADARFPANGQIGSIIRINTGYSSLSEIKKKFVIAHEIGHTIGLRHTNWREGEVEFATTQGITIGAYTIPGTPNSSNNPDPNSVFNSGEGVLEIPNWANFSSFDQIALQTLYPSFGPAQITTSHTSPIPVTMGQLIIASVDIPYWREGGLGYQWLVQGVTIISNSGNTIRVTVTDPNSAGVFCTITNGRGESTSVSKSFGSIEID